jgi:hypothetical protein
MLVEVEKTGLIMGTVLQMTWEEVERLLRTVEEVTTEVLVFVLVTRGRVSILVFVLDGVTDLAYQRK